LAIDPSSFISGGSILGDQTRMLKLSQHPNSFIRPSPNRLDLGGVTDTTTEVVTLCEAAGFEIIFVETVGVGQSEIEVANCVDMFVFVASPLGGDDLQGMKRGIMEMADLIVVNKAEEEFLKVARHAKSDFQHALRLSQSRRQEWIPKVVMSTCVDEKSEYYAGNVWKEMQEFREVMEKSGELEKQRKNQLKHATWKHVWRNVRSKIADMQPEFEGIEKEVMAGTIAPRQASSEILDKVWRS